MNRYLIVGYFGILIFFLSGCSIPRGIPIEIYSQSSGIEIEDMAEVERELSRDEKVLATFSKRDAVLIKAMLVEELYDIKFDIVFLTTFITIYRDSDVNSLYKYIIDTNSFNKRDDLVKEWLNRVKIRTKIILKVGDDYDIKEEIKLERIL